MVPFQLRRRHPESGARAVGGAAPERRVRLLEAPVRPPATPVERLARLAIASGGPLSLQVLVERVARELYLDEIRHGSWTVDIGFFGTGLFVPQVAREIQAAHGVLWHIEESVPPR